MQCCPNKLIIDIKTNFFIYLVRNCSIIFFLLKETFFLSMEDNKEHTWNKPTLNRSLSYAMLSEDNDFIKINYLIHLVANFKKMLLKQDFKILTFFDLEMKLITLMLFFRKNDIGLKLQFSLHFRLN